ncbi:unnamed protein product [Blepharisma stoltei]|uniref:GAR domain-containing protein n=1 Tax=Blepharisma stoltei TaxID=1481888 RepID=A0AAU9JNT8_9CILI|nr:unnamed protein product [Blepharisma stoltei]
MESKFICLKLQEVDIWSGKWEEIWCRISLEGKVATLSLKSPVKIFLSQLSPKIQIHLLIQTGNIALGSVTLSLEQVFGADLTQRMDQWFEFDVPGEVVALIESSTSLEKILRVRIIGAITSSQDFEFSEPEARVEIKESDNIEYVSEPQQEIILEHIEVKESAAKSDDISIHSEVIYEHKHAPHPIHPEENMNEAVEDFQQHIGISQIEEPRTFENIVESKPVEIAAEVKEKPDRARPQPLPISGPIRSGKCSYLDNIKGAEHHQKYTQNILDKLKEEMGQSFLKLVDDATRLRSRSPTRSGSRSPTKKLTARSPTRVAGGGSISSASKGGEEEEFVEIAGNSDVFLEKLSLKTKNGFIASIVGLLSKQSIYETLAREAGLIRGQTENIEKGSETLESSADETKEEIEKEFADYEAWIKEIKDEIRGNEESFQGLKKKNEMLSHEKESVLQQLAKLKSQKGELSSEAEISQLIEDIQDLGKAFENSQNKRDRLKADFEAYSQDYAKQADLLIIENLKLAENKSSLQEDLKSKSHQLESLNQENDSLLKEIEILEGQIGVSARQKSTLSIFQQASKSHESALDRIKSQVVSIRNSKDTFSTETFALQQQLESDLKKYKNLKVSSQGEIEKRSELIGDLKSKLNNLKGYIKQLEEIFAKKQNIDHVFDIVQSKGRHDFESKDLLVSELSYFSDFLFSLTQLYLKEHRIYKSLSAVFEEKEYDLNAMRRVVVELKMQNPVYFPADDDNIDQALSAFLNSRDEVVPVPFIREAKGVYLFGTRRVLISFERGKLIVKVGGGFLPIDDFVECYYDGEFEKLNHRPEEKSPRMKKFMAKWVGGLMDYKENDDEAMKKRLIKAVEGHKYSTAYAVKDKAKSRSRSQSPTKLALDEIIAASIGDGA